MAQGIGASPLPVKVKQADGSSITIVGKGTPIVHYTETVDGYSLIKNKKTIYEYAQTDSISGDLLPTGIKAHNKSRRSLNERNFLKKQNKHLRYTGKKLEELMQNPDNKNIQ